jgi:hypothetical protein
MEVPRVRAWRSQKDDPPLPPFQIAVIPESDAFRLPNSRGSASRASTVACPLLIVRPTFSLVARHVPVPSSVRSIHLPVSREPPLLFGPQTMDPSHPPNTLPEH